MAYSLATDVFQLLGPDGGALGALPELAPEQLRGFYRHMVFGRSFSTRLATMQRQGRMGTFAPLDGHEAASVAVAAHLEERDWMVGSYRDILSYLVRGVSPLAIFEQFRGYVTQRYTHEKRSLPIQIVIASQILHAVGLAMAIKYEGEPQVALALCGDGATSEGEFSEALNFAGAFRAPVVFVVQNNGWAISTPRVRQTAAAYLAHRGPAFGMPGLLVDGTDFFAVYQAMGEAVARARAGEGPTLIEAITYRLGAHTTADDPTRYRDPEELAAWQARDPIARFRRYLIERELLGEDEDEALHREVAEEIQRYVEQFEAEPPHDAAAFFDYVFAEPTPELLRQRAEILGAGDPREREEG
jgi:pyruvate dehydrogenase E1 component alpha subunit